MIIKEAQAEHRDVVQMLEMGALSSTTTWTIRRPSFVCTGGPHTINQGNGRGKWIYLNWRKLPPETNCCRWTVKGRPAMFYKNVNDSIRAQMEGSRKETVRTNRSACSNCQRSGTGTSSAMDWSFNQKSINNP